MSRELRRVPLDFNWPLDEIWEGYVNPHYTGCHECDQCGGSGYSPTGQLWKDRWYGNAPFDPSMTGSKPLMPETPEVWAFAERNCSRAPEFYGLGRAAIYQEAHRLCELWNGQWSHHLDQDDVDAMLAADDLHDLTHRFVRDEGWKPIEPPVVPSVEDVCRLSITGWGLNASTAIRARCEREGVSDTCSLCRGSGEIWDSEEAKQTYEAWTPTKPPEGPGYQLWETVSEGSPVSPVFDTPEKLANWLAYNPNYRFKNNDRGTTYEQWLTFITKHGWAPSGMGILYSDGTRETLSGVQGVLKASESDRNEESG